MSWKTDIGAN